MLNGGVERQVDFAEGFCWENEKQCCFGGFSTLKLYFEEFVVSLYNKGEMQGRDDVEKYLKKENHEEPIHR